jgi:hypothetical protein
MMGFFSNLLKIGGAVAAPFTGGASLIPTIAGAAGDVLGGMSEAKAKNRGSQFEGQMDLERLLLDRDNSHFNQGLLREQEGRAGGMDAWKRLMMAQHVSNQGQRPQLSPYSIAPRERSAEELQGANAMTNEVMARLMGGNPIAPVQSREMSVDPRLLTPGKMESAMGYLHPLLGALGKIKRPEERMSGVPMGSANG